MKLSTISNQAKFILAKRLFGVGPTDDWSYVDQFQGPAKDIKLLEMYSGITYRCIDTIATAVAGKYQPYMYTLDSKGAKVTNANHPLAALLQRPNPDMSMFQMFEGSQTFLELFGEYFWYMVPGSVTGYGNGVKEIYLLRPDKMGINIDKASGEVIGYVYNTGSGNRIPFEPEEIIHQMNFDPKNPYRGVGTTEKAIDYILTESEARRFTKNYLGNNASLSGVLSVEGKISRENWKKFVRQWRERYQGVDNAGKVALVRDSQFSFTPTSSTIKDMNLTEIKDTALEDVLMMYKIPKGILGMESGEGLGRASVETLEYIFAKWTIDDKLNRFDDTIKQIADRYYAKFQAFVDHVGIIPADKEYELNRLNLLVDRVITRAEARLLDPLTANTEIQGTDQLFVPINMVPLSDPETPEAANSSSGKAIKVVKAKKKVKKYSARQKEAFRKSLQKNVQVYAKKYVSSMRATLDKQQQTVLNNITHLTGKSLTDSLFNSDNEDQSLDDSLTPLATDLASVQGALAMAFAGSEDQYNLSQSYQKALQASLKRMAQNFDDETLVALNSTLAEGVTAGEGFEALSSRVADVYQQAKDYRTDRVAQTESQYASNSATLDAYQQTGYIESQEWYANPGACDYCEELDGTQVGLDQSFVNQGDSVDVTNDDGDTSSYQCDYGDVDTPPLHPNCECCIIPVTETM